MALHGHRVREPHPPHGAASSSWAFPPQRCSLGSLAFPPSEETFHLCHLRPPYDRKTIFQIVSLESRKPGTCLAGPAARHAAPLCFSFLDAFLLVCLFDPRGSLGGEQGLQPWAMMGKLRPGHPPRGYSSLATLLVRSRMLPARPQAQVPWPWASSSTIRPGEPVPADGMAGRWAARSLVQLLPHGVASRCSSCCNRR